MTWFWVSFFPSPICSKHLRLFPHLPGLSEWRHIIGFAVITIPAGVFSGFLCDNKHKRNVFGGFLTGTPYVFTRHASAAERKVLEHWRSLRDANLEIFHRFRFGYTCNKRRCTRACPPMAAINRQKTKTHAWCFSNLVIIMGRTAPSRFQLNFDGTR